MFGYVVVNKPELKFKEFDIYRAYYCGLCQSLRKRYGLSGQLTLTYDMTFLVILLSSLYEPELAASKHRCIAHPLKKQMMINSKYTDYVADMNVMLSYYKCIDDWKDDNNLLKLAFSKLLRTDILKENPLDGASVENYKEKSKAIAALLDELGSLEKINETNIDVMAGTFGKIMAILFAPKKDPWSEGLSKIGFYLGKFIYILDAFDDVEKDVAKGRYNPFKEIYTASDFVDNIKQMLTMMMAECSSEFEMLPIIDNANILRNILYSGVWNTFEMRSEKSGNPKK